MSAIDVDPHPLLRLGAFASRLDAPLGALATPPAISALLALEAGAPFERDEDVRQAIRRLLRHGGYKPTGRGKPSSEYLVRAAGEGALGSINLAVDCGNAVSLASGIPISVVDLDRVRGGLRVGLGAPGEGFAFNASGQAIDVSGLLGLRDEDGPCANAVKDAQRTKTGAETRRTLSLLWSSRELGERTERVLVWYRELLRAAGVRTEEVELAGGMP